MDISTFNLEDKVKLKEERKIRKKVKKEQKKQERNQEKEKQTILKHRSTDQHIQMITMNTLETISNKISSNLVIRCNCRELNLDEQLSEFPCLGEQQIRKSQNDHLDNCILLDKNTDLIKSISNKKSKQPIKIDVVEALEIVKQEPHGEKNIKIHTRKEILSGNILDSANPERKSGKHRETFNKKKVTQLKSAILKEREKIKNVENEPILKTEIEKKDYSDNIVSPILDTAVKNLLTDLVYFQNRLYNQDPFKGFLKRRYVVGFNEVEKYVTVNKLKLIIIAPNLESNEVITNKIKLITEAALVQNIPYVFALNRRILGHITFKKIRVSCVGILSYSGSETNFENVLTLSQEAKRIYKENN